MTTSLKIMLCDTEPQYNRQDTGVGHASQDHKHTGRPRALADRKHPTNALDAHTPFPYVRRYRHVCH